MADNYAYDSRSDGDLRKDWIKRHSDGYLREHHISEKSAVLDLSAPAAATFTMTSTVITDDQYNLGQLYVTDDNGVPCIFTVADCAALAGSPTFTVDMTAAVVPGAVDVQANFTTAGTYVVSILGTERFIGYTDDKKYVPDVATNDAEVDMPRVRIFSYKISEKGTVTLTLLTSPLSLLDNFYNMETTGGSPNTGSFKYHVLGSDRPTYSFTVKNIRTKDSNETRQEIYPNCQFDEPELMLEASSGGDLATYALTANVNKDSALGTDRINSTI